jgi:NADPH-dependent curcumin reductase CurA
MMAKSREIRLASRPKGWPTLENFTLAETELPTVAEGQVLVRNLFMSVDPYMRGRMNDMKSYVPPFQIRKPLEGGAVGEIIESRASGFGRGDVVTSMLGWRDSYVAESRALQRVDAKIQPLSAYLGMLGMPGLTAWVGLKLVEVKSGDRIFISGAAGAVGSVAGQLAKLRGCRVIGSAGSADKIAWLLHDLGFDAAFNYKDGPVYPQLKKAAPDGIDVYFDNVGGEHLEAALSAMNLNGRIIACGGISGYNQETQPPGPRNMMAFVSKRLTMKGFIVMDWMSSMLQFQKEAGALWSSGRLKMRETVVEGLENAPQAFLDMLHGANIGKMVVKLA